VNRTAGHGPRTWLVDRNGVLICPITSPSFSDGRVTLMFLPLPQHLLRFQRRSKSKTSMICRSIKIVCLLPCIKPQPTIYSNLTINCEQYDLRDQSAKVRLIIRIPVNCYHQSKQQPDDLDMPLKVHLIARPTIPPRVLPNPAHAHQVNLVPCSAQCSILSHV
jgi:hypothetical protein